MRRSTGDPVGSNKPHHQNDQSNKIKPTTLKWDSVDPYFITPSLNQIKEILKDEFSLKIEEKNKTCSAPSKVSQKGSSHFDSKKQLLINSFIKSLCGGRDEGVPMVPPLSSLKIDSNVQPPPQFSLQPLIEILSSRPKQGCTPVMLDLGKRGLVYTEWEFSPVSQTVNPTKQVQEDGNLEKVELPGGVLVEDFWVKSATCPIDSSLYSCLSFDSSSGEEDSCQSSSQKRKSGSKESSIRMGANLTRFLHLSSYHRSILHELHDPVWSEKVQQALQVNSLRRLIDDWITHLQTEDETNDLKNENQLKDGEETSSMTTGDEDGIVRTQEKSEDLKIENGEKEESKCYLWTLTTEEKERIMNCISVLTAIFETGNDSNNSHSPKHHKPHKNNHSSNQKYRKTSSLQSKEDGEEDSFSSSEANKTDDENDASQSQSDVDFDEEQRSHRCASELKYKHEKVIDNEKRGKPSSLDTLNNPASTSSFDSFLTPEMIEHFDINSAGGSVTVPPWTATFGSQAASWSNIQQQQQQHQQHQQQQQQQHHNSQQSNTNAYSYNTITTSAIAAAAAAAIHNEVSVPLNSESISMTTSFYDEISLLLSPFPVCKVKPPPLTLPLITASSSSTFHVSLSPTASSLRGLLAISSQPTPKCALSTNTTTFHKVNHHQHHHSSLVHSHTLQRQGEDEHSLLPSREGTKTLSHRYSHHNKNAYFDNNHQSSSQGEISKSTDSGGKNENIHTLLGRNHKKSLSEGFLQYQNDNSQQNLSSLKNSRTYSNHIISSTASHYNNHSASTTYNNNKNTNPSTMHSPVNPFSAFISTYQLQISQQQNKKILQSSSPHADSCSSSSYSSSSSSIKHSKNILQTKVKVERGEDQNTSFQSLLGFSPSKESAAAPQQKEQNKLFKSEDNSMEEDRNPLSVVDSLMDTSSHDSHTNIQNPNSLKNTTAKDTKKNSFTNQLAPNPADSSNNSADAQSFSKSNFNLKISSFYNSLNPSSPRNHSVLSSSSHTHFQPTPASTPVIPLPFYFSNSILSPPSLQSPSHSQVNNNNGNNNKNNTAASMNDQALFRPLLYIPSTTPCTCEVHETCTCHQSSSSALLSETLHPHPSSPHPWFHPSLIPLIPVDILSAVVRPDLSSKTSWMPPSLTAPIQASPVLVDSHAACAILDAMTNSPTSGNTFTVEGEEKTSTEKRKAALSADSAFEAVLANPALKVGVSMTLDVQLGPLLTLADEPVTSSMPYKQAMNVGIEISPLIEQGEEDFYSSSSLSSSEDREVKKDGAIKSENAQEKSRKKASPKIEEITGDDVVKNVVKFEEEEKKKK
eukprot:GDKJ01008391.1.p1 GENE.GDKJ01008391.1~~GDKJ01008391.1.p1  ORF type:complete len:1313 (-),score=411.61 GDKJ01008391.1:29-3967(-)